MGQLITVSRKPAVKPGVAIFELNRSLTGMGHERYRAGESVEGRRPVDELARRLLDADGVRSLHVYSNMVTVEVSPGTDVDHLAEVIGDLFTYYREGVEVADPMAAAPSD